MITQDQVKELFNYNPDTGILTWKVRLAMCVWVGDEAGSTNGVNYLHTKINGKDYMNHRIIFLWCYGYLPKYLDHIDGDKLNNKINNLRACTPSENQRNRKLSKNNTSGIKGVSWSKASNKWHASIQINRKTINVGFFSCIKNAELAIKKARKLVHGSFANHGTYK